MPGTMGVGLVQSEAGPVLCLFYTLGKRRATRIPCHFLLQDAEGWVRVGGADPKGKGNVLADAPVAEDHAHMEEAAHELEDEKEDAVQTVPVVGGVAVEEQHGEKQEEEEEDGSIEDCEL
jgi:hypothetical protein